MRRLKKALSVILAEALCATLCLGSAYTGVFAASTNTYTLKELAQSDSIKYLGRTRIEGNDLIAEWTCSGFEMNINVPAGGTVFTVNVDSTLARYADIIVDGDESTYVRGEVSKTSTSVSATLTAGNHTVRVIKDSSPDKAADMTEENLNKFVNETHYKFCSVSFAGTVLEKPQEKARYIEWLGSSSTCGCGSINPYVAGTSGGSAPKYSSGIYSFGYMASELLDADCSLIAVGGYGLLDATSGSQEDVKNPTTMRDLYPYVAGERDFLNESKYEKTVEKYDFVRKPDCVVIGVGANDDTISKSFAKMEPWKEAATDIIETVLQKYNDRDIPIVWFVNGDHGVKYNQYLYLMNLAENTYKNLHVLRIDAGGNGGVAQSTQFVGHPSKYQYEMEADALVSFMKTEKIFTDETPAPTPAATEVVRYVDGVSGGDGTKACPFTYIKDAEASLKTEIAGISGDDDSISAKIYVMNKQAAEAAPTLSDPTPYNRSLTGYTETVKTSDGKQITVEIIGIDSENNGEKPVIYAADAHSITESNGWRRAFNNYRFENIKVTGSGREGNVSGKVMGAFNVFYAYGNTVTIDKGAEFCNAKKNTPLSADYFDKLYAGNASESSSIKTETAAKSLAKSNLTINDGCFDLVYAIGSTAVGAYGTKDDLSDWKYDVLTSDRYFNVTVNGGTVNNLYGGKSNLVTGKRINVIITVNGGLVKNLAAAAQTIAAYSKKQYGNFTVNINGGTVEKYVGLTGGSIASEYNGNYTLNMNGNGVIGTKETTLFASVGNNVTAKSIENNISGGTIRVVSKTASEDGIYLGGYKSTTVGTVVNNISGGAFLIRAIADLVDSEGNSLSKKVQAAMYMGGLDNYSAESVTNNISGGQFFILPYDEDAETNPDLKTITYSGSNGIYMGCLGGSITALNNNIKNGYFDGRAVKSSAQFNFASQGTGSFIGKITNVLGNAGRDDGPCFTGGPLYLGGVKCNVGAAAKGITYQLDETDINNMSDEVVISNTIHYTHTSGITTMGGYYGRSTATTGKTTVINVAGSVDTVINQGNFEGDVYCGGGEIYGHVKTTVNGGHYKNLFGYGTNKDDSRTYNGTELILNGPTGNDPFVNNGFNSYSAISTNEYNVYGGGNNTTVVRPLDSSKPALRLTVNGGTFPANCSVISGGNTNCTVNGDIETVIAAKTAVLKSLKAIYASSKGNVNGNATLNVATGTGSTLGNIILSPDAGKTLNGNVTVLNTSGAHYTNILSGNGTVTGEKTVNLDLSKGAITVNNKIGTPDMGDYTVKGTGKTGNVFMVTSATNIEFDELDISDTAKITFREYANAKSGTVYAKLPANTDLSNVVLDCDYYRTSQKLTNYLTLVPAGDFVGVAGVTGLLNGYFSVFVLNDSISAKIFVEKSAYTDEIIGNFGKILYQYKFLDTLKSGTFDGASLTETYGNKEYYAVKINIPTGRFDNNIDFYCSGGMQKVFSVNTLLEAGKQQYAGDADSVALFDAMEDYGKEAAYKFYGGEDPQIDYGDMSDLIAKYDVTTQKTAYKYIDGVNLRLADKVSVQFYTKLADVSDITKITVNDVETKFTASAVTGLGDCKNVINIPIGVSKMCDAVTVKLYEGDTVVDEYYTSIGHLCKQIINDRSVPSYHNLAKSLLKYIEAADNYFNK